MKEKMITRTVITKNISALVVNLTTMKVETVSVTCPDIDGKALNDFISGYVEPNKLVQFEEVSKNETLYGMPESLFIKHAKVLPPRAVKKEES